MTVPCRSTRDLMLMVVARRFRLESVAQVAEQARDFYKQLAAVNVGVVCFRFRQLHLDEFFVVFVGVLVVLVLVCTFANWIRGRHRVLQMREVTSIGKSHH